MSKVAKRKGGKKSKTALPRERKALKPRTRVAVLTEAGYRCAVPTCRSILAIDLHHMYQVSEGGGDDPSNLIALCPNCHSLYHLGHISRDAIYAYKAMLVALSRAFDVEAIDKLLFLQAKKKDFLVVSGDGLLHFARLIAAGLATGDLKANNNWQVVTYAVNLTPKGRQLVSAWEAGDRVKLKETLSGATPH